MSKNTKVAAQFLTITSAPSDTDLILAEGADVDLVLAGSLRAPSQYGLLASHRTNSTRKYQVMAAIPYEDCLKVLIAKNELPSEAAAIRLCFEAGLRAMGFGRVVDDVHSEGEGEEQ